MQKGWMYYIEVKSCKIAEMTGLQNWSVGQETSQELQQQLNLTIDGLKHKWEELNIQIDQFEKLQVQIQNGNEENVVVYLGIGYYVEKSRGEAINFLTRKISSLKEAASLFGGKIQEAELLSQSFETTGLSDQDERAKSRKGTNEEGLPFVDIVEHLDEEGNVLSAKINNDVQSLPPPENVSSPNGEGRTKSSETNYLKGNNIHNKEVANDEAKSNLEQIKGQGYEVENTQAEDADQLSELLQDMELIKKDDKRSSEILIDQNVLLEKIDNLKVSPDDKFKLKQICIEQYRMQEEETFDKQDRFSTGNITTDISENSLDEIAGIERQKVLANIIEENNLSNNLVDQATLTSTPKSLDLDRDDVLELELLADEFDEDDALAPDFADSEEWDFEFSDHDEEDAREDFADSLLYSGKFSFLQGTQNENVNNLLWNQVRKLREEKSLLSNESSIPESLAENDGESKQTKRKSVRFAESLEIKEIENISDFIKNAPVEPKRSLFLQERLGGGRSRETEKLDAEEKSESALEETVVERNIDKVFEQLDGRNKSIPVQVSGKRVSEFESDYKIFDEPLDRYSLMNQSISENEDKHEKPKKVSRFKSSIIKAAPRSVSEFIPSNQEVINHVEPGTTLPTKVDTINGDVVERDTSAVPRDAYEFISPKINSGKLGHQNLIQEAEEGPKSISRDLVQRDESTEKSSEALAAETFSAHGERDREETSSKEFQASQADSNVEDHNIDVKEAVIDFPSMQHDMDTMAKAYVLGMYDEDIETEGPVVDKLEDFEILNKMIESMPSRNVSIESDRAEKEKQRKDRLSSRDQFDPILDEIERQDEFDDEENAYSDNKEDEDDENDDGPALAYEVIERGFDDTLEMDLEDSIETDLMSQEIVTNYHRLRQKVIFESNKSGYKKTEQEFEYDPVDEDGNPIHVSRFKATKLNFENA